MAIYETYRSLKEFDFQISDTWENPSFHAHLHESFELLYVQAGELSVGVEGTEYRLRAGQQILILPNLIHEFQSKTADTVMQLVIFSADYLPELWADSAANRFRHPVLEGLGADFQDLIAHRDDRFLFRADLYRIAAAYAKNSLADLPLRRDQEISVKIFAYLEAHYREPIDEIGVARSLGYHPRYLSKKINRNFGVSFKALLNEVRIRVAKDLLKTTELSVTEIYTRAGFDSQSAFNRNFKLLTGKTPREYRRKIKT